ncbi:3-keto-disaccharide hydrolase [Seonamhaeicola aphaedonensis]|uniref:Uncharacterized protein DUF1080 n=1 Tax=Seonamhaeicola aphaedonensis TaxID=1461338 RepID=A0A3D9HL70_9FLAO|nr:DUF1080 domain-containing protein [Seonamhaeicola aphaedonensis]RED50252.1 uncharacterized protein DUF1080 [Seonamhaeicola aphaedonensis]
MKSNLIKIICILLIFSFTLSCKKKPENPNTKTEWKSIFNGKDLEGWTPKIMGFEYGNNYKNTFIVEDGLLKVSYKAYDSFNNAFGHLFYKTPYSNYRFKMDYRFLGEQVAGGKAWALRNSGIMIHCEDPKGMELNQNFPVCIEVQLLGGNGIDERSTGNLCTPGTNVFYNDTLVTQHIIKSSSKTYHGDQWVNVEIEVRNDSIIKHFINGEEVLAYNKPHIGGGAVNTGDKWSPKENEPLKSGYISLQSESHPVEFKNIKLMELK